MGRRRLETYEDYDRALRQGFGLGELRNYKPWHRVQDFGSKGQSSKIPGILIHRPHHLLSNVEKALFLHVERDKTVLDIREQFPILPLCLTQAIADEIGIKHPRNRSRKAPWVVSTDILATRGTENAKTYHAYAAKMSTDLLNRRTMELLELERLSCLALGMTWNIVTNLQFDKNVVANLDWSSEVLRGRLKKKEAGEISDELKLAVAQSIEVGTHAYPILVASISADFQVDEELASTILRIAIWEDLIGVDLTLPIQRSGIVHVTRRAESENQEAMNAVG